MFGSVTCPTYGRTTYDRDCTRRKHPRLVLQALPLWFARNFGSETNSQLDTIPAKTTRGFRLSMCSFFGPSVPSPNGLRGSCTIFELFSVARASQENWKENQDVSDFCGITTYNVFVESEEIYSSKVAELSFSIRKSIHRVAIPFDASSYRRSFYATISFRHKSTFANCTEERTNPFSMIYRVLQIFPVFRHIFL